MAQPAKSSTGNDPHGHNEQETDPASLTPRGATPGVSWDFSKIPLYPPERASRPQSSSSLAPFPGAIQAKLAVGPAEDPLEHEADRVADQVMRMPDPELSRSQPGRDGAPRDSETPSQLRTKSAVIPVANGNEAPPPVHEALRSRGHPLDASTRAFFEPRFGHDFSHVRVHADASAATSAHAIGALAYTVGQDLVFASNRYDPQTSTGRRLLAHELAHSIQQREARSAPGSLIQRDVPAPAAPAPGPATTAWSKSEIKAVQTELVRLGLYASTIDGVLGEDSKAGLVEAFGSAAWQMLDAVTALSQLKAAKPMAGGKKGQHRFRWGEMFKDGLLDMVLGVGFDEGGANATAYNNFVKALADRGFAKDKAAAAKLFQAAGRPMGPSAFGDFFVKKDAISYAPPVGPARKISAVVRLVASVDGSQGAQVADAFKEGMASSDIAYYSGHGRYGSGPDFDRNYTFDLLDVKGTIEQTIADYSVLEKAMAREGAAAKRDAWSQFMWRVNNKRIDVHASNTGNVVLNTKNPHPGEFGSKLMYWNLNRASGGSAPVTGATGSLATSAAAVPERKYHLQIFDGCRSEDYVKALRATPGFDTKKADILGSSRELMWGDEGPTLVQFLDGILKMLSAEEIITNMDKQQREGTGAYHGYGIGDNPVVK